MTVRHLRVSPAGRFDVALRAAANDGVPTRVQRARRRPRRPSGRPAGAGLGGRRPPPRPRASGAAAPGRAPDEPAVARRSRARAGSSTAACARAATASPFSGAPGTPARPRRRSRSTRPNPHEGISGRLTFGLPGQGVSLTFPARIGVMKKLMLLFSLVALAAPIAAFADAPPSPAQTAKKMCVAAKTAMGTSFATTYATNASKSNALASASRRTRRLRRTRSTTRRSRARRSWRMPTSPRRTATRRSISIYGGGNGKGSPQNAMGKCVSQAVQSAVAAQAKASKSALKSCKAAMKADKAAFATTYGTGRDALGKCVAAKSGTK